MTDLIVDSIVPRSQVVLNAAQTNVSIPFSYLTNTGLAIYINDVLKTLTTHYTVNGAGTAGPYSITLTTPAVGGEILTAVRTTDSKRVTNFADSGEWTADNVNKELNRLTMVDQELGDKFSRVIRLQDSDVSRSLVLPLKAACLNKALIFDANGGLTVSADNYNDQVAAVAAALAAAEDAADAAAASAAAVNAMISVAMQPVCASASIPTARTNLGLGSLSTLNSVNNTNWSGTALSLANGGTGAVDATGARAALGLGALAILSNINNSNWSGTVLSLANGGTGAADAPTARTNLGLGSLAVLNAVNNGNWSGTALSVANGGTGAATAGAALDALYAGGSTGYLRRTATGAWSTDTVRKITTGSTDAVLSSDGFIAWDSSTLSAKTQTISAASWLQQLTIKDAHGDAGTYPITLTASGCTIDGQASLVIDANYGAVSLKWDGTSNWMVF